MKRLVPLLAIAVLAGVSPAGDKPKESVRYATDWEAAVEEAKALNLPIVVHSHGFYCPPCWGMHGALLQGKKYIGFAEDNTVEVVVVSQIEKGIESADRKAATYKAKGPDGQDLECLVEWPGLTAEQLQALGRSHAATYNDTGGVPHTAIVDPHTLKMVAAFPGGTSAKSIMGAVEEARKALDSEHGRGASRKDLARLEKDALGIRAHIEAGRVDKAVEGARGLEKGTAGKAKALGEKAAKVLEEAMAAAGKRLDELEAVAARGAAKDAAREAGPLARALKGTPLQERAEAILSQAKNS